MTKISKKAAYPVKIPVRKDYFVGTDSENNGKTVNFEFESTAKLINEINGTPILNYIFRTDYNIELTVLTEGVFLSAENETTVTGISKLYINKNNFHETDMSDLFRFISINREVFLLKLRNSSNLSNAVYFNIIGATEYESYFTLDVTIDKNNAALPELINYNVYFFDFDLKAGSGDKGDKGDKGDQGIQGIDGEIDPIVLEEIDTRISELEGSQVLYNRFTGKSYSIWSGIGLVYDVYYTSYYLENVLYPGGYSQKTLLASDPTNPRFDLIKVDAMGVQVATGTPSASPEIPTADPNTELAISPVLVDAGALTPTGVSNEDVYKESAEWSRTSNNGTVNFNATTNPFQGTFHIDCGAFTNGQYLRFTDTVVNQIADFSLLKFYVNLKATFANTAKFSVRFYNGTTVISSTVTIASGSYNFLRTTINAYQTVIIPLADFTFSSSSFDRIEVVMVGTNASGFRMDNIVLSQGVGSSSPEQNAITSIVTDSGIANATIKDDTFQFRGASGLIVSAVGKIITFTSNFTSALKTNYDSAYNWVSTNGANVITHLSRTDNPHSVTKSQVGLGSVDNTSDVNKPVSTLQAAADATVLADGKTYADGLITQLINNAPADANTLKELNDKIIAIQAIIGGSTADGDSIVNTVAELLAVFSTYTEGVDLVTLLAGKVSTTDVYNALDCIVSGKTLDARQGKVLNDLITALTTVVSGKEDSSNKSQDIEADKTSTTKYSSVKQLYDWAVAKFQAALVSGTNIKTINGTSVLGSGDIAIVGGGGDMVLATAQTVTGEKTFLDTKFSLRNVADTFSSYFTNTNTASRTYTLPNSTGTLALLESPIFTGTVTSPALNLSTFTAGSIPFIGASGVLSQDNSNLFWDNTNKLIKIRNSISIGALNAFGLNYFLVNGLTSNQGICASFAPKGNPTGYGYNFQFAKVEGGGTSNLLMISGNGAAGSNSDNKHNIVVDNTAGSNSLVLKVAPTNNGWGITKDHITIFPTGNVVIQNTAPVATDAGYGLDVVGTSRAASFVKSGGTSSQFLKADGSVDSSVYSKSFKGAYSTTATATTTFTVSIGQTMANTSYVAIPVATNMLSAVLFSVQNKTTTTFDIVVAAGLTGAVAYDFTITP